MRLSVARLLLREVAHRPGSFVLAIVLVGAAAALFVAGPALVGAHARDTDGVLSRMDAEHRRMEDELADQTRKLMRDMGFNLMIVHRDTDMADFWSRDFSTVDMPEDYVQRLADARSITLVTHIVATLQQKIKWNGRSVLLTGYLPETPQAHKKKKKPMGYVVDEGSVVLGYELGNGLEAGGSVDVLGRKFKIERILREQGSKEDITIVMNLRDAQALLDKEGRVNQILALGCRCAGERLPKVREELAEVLPDTRITEFRSIALARAEMRDRVTESNEEERSLIATTRGETQQLLEKLSGVVVPLVVVICAIWVALLALANVRERRSEIGILRAVGIGTGKVAALFMGKALIQGLVGGVLGAAIGVAVARAGGAAWLGLEAEGPLVSTELVALTVLGAPLVCAMASYLPALAAVVRDPADVLRAD